MPTPPTQEEFQEWLGQRLREARRARGFTQADLAAAAEVSSETVSRTERGEFAPNVWILARIATACRTSLAQLLSGHAPGKAPTVSLRAAEMIDRLDPDEAKALLDYLRAAARARDRARRRRPAST
jgi:putative transcriptional regulator